MAGLKREVLLLVRDAGLWILTGLYALLLVYGSFQSVFGYRAAINQIADARAEHDQRWNRMASAAASVRNELWGSWKSASLAGSGQGGAVAWFDPAALSALNLGQGARENPVRRISLYDSPVAPPLSNPMNALYGEMDLGFVGLWMLPLIALLMAHQALGRDWESGVWPLVLVSGISLYRLVLARLALPFGILMFLSTFAAVNAIALTSGRYEWHLSIWALAMGIYAATWMALGAWLGLGARNPSRQLLIAGALWLGSVWVAPGLIDAVAELAAPPVNATDGLLADRDAQLSSSQAGANLMRRVYREHPDWQPSTELVQQMNKPVPGGPRKRDARNVLTNYLAAEEAAAPILERLAQRRLRAEEVAYRFSFLSPLVAMQYLMEEVAGTSYERYRGFDTQAEAFLREWRAFFAEKVWRLEEMKVQDIERRPRFQPQFNSMTRLAARAALPASGLFFWCAVVCSALFWRIRRFSLV